MSGEISLLSASRNKIESNLITVAQNYFKTEDINTFKSGLLGYLINVMSDSLSDNQVYNSFIFDEKFINTAKFRSSVSMNADDFGYDEGYATPCKIMAVLGMKIEDFDINNTSIDIHPEDISIKYGNITYSIGGTINLNLINGKWYVKQVDNNLFPCSLGLLPSEQVLNNDGENYITFVAELRQVTVTYETTLIPIRTDLLRYYIPFSITNQLYSVNIYTYVNGAKVYFEKLNSFLSTDKDLTKYVFLLETIDETSFNIVLDSGEYFKFVSSGTELHIEIIETDGVNGYIESPVFNINTDNELINRVVVGYSSVSSTVGSDKLNLLDLKKDVIRYIQTPDDKTIITEFDYVNVISKVMGVYPDDISLLIRRNDPIERRVEIFSKYTNTNNEFIHSNTVDLLIDTTVDGTLIPQNSLLKFNTLNGYVEPSTDTEYETDGIYYRTSFTHKLNTNPIETMSTFNTQFKNVVLDTKEKYFATNGIYLFFLRESFVTHFGENLIKFRTRVSSNTPIALSTDSIMQKVKVRVLIKSVNDNSSLYFDLEFNPNADNKTILEADIETNENIDTEGNIQVKGVYYRQTNTDTYTLINAYDGAIKAYIPNMFSMQLFTYFEDKSVETTPTVLNDGNTLFYSSLGSNTNKFLFSTYTTSGSVQLIKNISDIMSTDVVYIEPNKYLVKLLPLFSAKEMDSSANTSFFRDYYEKLTLVKEAMKFIKEEPSTVSFKLFNTHGKNSEFINTTVSNIKLSLEISYNYNLADQSIFDDIRTVIVSYFKDRNTLGLNSSLESRNIYLSDIISEVENKINGIIQVRILNRDSNIYFDGALNYKELTSQVIKTYVPSIINIKKEDITITVK